MDKKRRLYYISVMVSLFFLVLIDQITKVLATSHLKGQPAIPVIKNIFELEYLENTGAAFGVMKGKFVFFMISFLIIAVLFAFFIYRVPMTKRFRPLRICVLFILAGALGNMIDRFVHKYVVDFFYFKAINFPVFNVADVYVTLATLALILLILFYYKEEDLEQLLHRRGQRRKEN